MRNHLLAVPVVALLIGVTATMASAAGGIAIEDWKNIPAGTESWQSATLQAKDMMYPEGGTIPYRLTLPQPLVGNAWSITIEYDFADQGTGVHFCDFLTSYNAYEASVTGQSAAGTSYFGESNKVIPADPALAFQLPGVFRVVNGTITNMSAYSTVSTGGVTVKQVTLSGTAVPGHDVLILFGAHLARDYEWGDGKGAHEWPSGVASLGFTNYSGGNGTSGHTNIKVSDNIMDNASQSDLSVYASASSNPVAAGDNLTYNILVANSGPLAAPSDTVTETIPVGTTLVTATQTYGWTLSAPNGRTVRWVRSGVMAENESATFMVVVNVNPGATGTVENTVTVECSYLDAYQLNNVCHTSTLVTPSSGSATSGGGMEPGPGSNPQSGDGEILPRSGNDRGTTPGWSAGSGPVEPGGSDGSSEDPVMRRGHRPASGPTPTAGTPAPPAGTPAPTSGQNGGSAVPQGTPSQAPASAGILVRSFPNPFTSSVHMAYAVNEPEAVDISVYDLAGRQLTVLANGTQSPGQHAVAWDGRDASGVHVQKGMYFVRIQIGNQVQQARVTMN